MQRIIFNNTNNKIFATFFCVASLDFCAYENGCLYVNRLANLLFISFSFVLLDCARFWFSKHAARFVIIFRFIGFVLGIGYRRCSAFFFSKGSFLGEEQGETLLFIRSFFLSLSNYNDKCWFLSDVYKSNFKNRNIS